jgi:hypothetical protein
MTTAGGTNAQGQGWRSRWGSLLVLILIGILSTANGAALEITNVRAEPRVVAPLPDAVVSIVFRLSDAARVALQIYDGRDLLVRRIQSDGPVPAGDASLTWDVRDQSGRPVPPEAYTFTLRAIDEAGAPVEHDLTDLTGSGEVLATDVHWDASAGVVRYRLPAPARVNIRIGLKDDGPLLRTLIDWVPRDAGEHQEPWDGRDASGVLTLTEHPGLTIAIDAFALSDNSILVGAPQTEAQLIADLPWGEEHRVVKRTPGKQMQSHAQQALTERGDYHIDLTLPPGLPTDAEGLPMVAGILPIRLDIQSADRGRALARRFEPVFFVDGTFAFENEVGFLPMTWRWDSRGVNPGLHFVTVNLRGYEGNFGMATIRVRVRSDSDRGPVESQQ